MEFAIVVPLLLLLLFGIVEFGWVLGQYNEIRHAGQEGARWGAVSRPDIDGGGLSASDLRARVCDAVNLPSGSTTSVAASPGGGAKGATGSVTVTASVASLTGLSFITAFLPAQLVTTATFRLEQPAAWSGFGPVAC